MPAGTIRFHPLFKRFARLKMRGRTIKVANQFPPLINCRPPDVKIFGDFLRACMYNLSGLEAGSLEQDNECKNHFQARHFFCDHHNAGGGDWLDGAYVLAANRRTA